ncbi:DUF2079 domain-containing protein [Kitasatospora saccharophila]|uniref:DUF2079 domain-containing protein n=1 Tax=Kitasatospora saccharophila TaxID=407973 RepID=UPI003624C692
MAGRRPADPLLLPGQKWLTVLVLLLPTAFLALRSPLVLLAVPPLAARFWSADPAYWDVRQHYNAVLMPILFLALADGLGRVRGEAPGRERTLPRRVALLVPALVPVLALLLFPTSLVGSAPPRLADARAVLATVPDGARVAAANRLAPQLTGRCTVSLFPYLTRPGRDAPWGRPTAEWVAVLDRPDDFPLPEAEMVRARAELADQGYREVAAGGGVAVYRWSSD